MANDLRLATTTRQAMIAAYVTDVSTTPRLIFRSGSFTAGTEACGSVDAGSALAIITLASSWVTSAAGVTTIASGPWTGTGASAGTIGHYRLKSGAASITDNTGTTKEQGTVGVGTFDIALDNAVIAVGQTISISTWTRTQAGS